MSTAPIDLNTLQLLRAVAHHRNFTKAAEACGLSQSALTRQVQNAEARLGIALFERTTRSVTITEAGAILLRETETIDNILSGALRRINEECLNQPKLINIGLSKGLSLAHLPGIFRTETTSRIIVSQPKDHTLLNAISAGHLDLAILPSPTKLPKSLQQLQIIDDFFLHLSPASRSSSTWILPPADSGDRSLINSWLRSQQINPEQVIELENYDMAIQLCSLGMGQTIAPRRAFSQFPRKHLINKHTLTPNLKRTLSIITPKHAHTPEHVQQFLDRVLFS